MKPAGPLHALVAALVLGSCASPGPSGPAAESSDPLTAFYIPGGSLDDLPGPLAPDAVPYYGPTDRGANPEFAAADEALRRDTIAEFGSARAASDMVCDTAREAYRETDYATSAVHFNQAWLIDPTNPEVPLGFASIYHDHGNTVKAREFVDEAVALGLESSMALADAALIYAVGVSDGTGLGPAEAEALGQQSKELVALALDRAPTPDARQYAYESWVLVLLQLDDLDGAQSKAALMDAAGMRLTPATQELLDAAASTPTR
ncbi:MAG: tetratricopeptide repeat protein [Planctomycetota bacterium]